MGKIDKTIIFCTENLCPEPLFSAVIKDLKRKAAHIPIISVSHKPIDLGTNICIGEHRRSWFMLYKQILLGLRLADTTYIGIVEHDCFYTEEHLNYIPPKDDTFYYNENIWLVSYDNVKRPEKFCTYSRYGRQRLALSQMVCNRRLYKDAIERRIEYIRKDNSFTKNIDHVNEPGVSKLKQKLIDRAHNGSSAYIKHLLPEFIELEQYEVFNTKIPNLDVRHGLNFTGPRNGRQVLKDVPYWGKFDELISSLTPAHDTTHSRLHTP